MPCLRSIVAVALAFTSDLGNFLKAMVRSRTSLASRELVSAKAVGILQGTQNAAATADGRGSLHSRRVVSDVRLENALVVVKPDTLIGWHRKGFRLFWRWKSRPGRPTLHPEIRALIVRMAGENPTWGQMRVAAELYLKLGTKPSLK